MIGIHAGHSLPVHGQTSGPTGTPFTYHTVVQVSGLGGMHVGATRLHTGCVTPVHVCEENPPQVWSPMPAQVPATGGTQVWVVAPLQVCGARVPQVCDCAPLHVCGTAPTQVWGVPEHVWFCRPMQV